MIVGWVERSETHHQHIGMAHDGWWQVEIANAISNPAYERVTLVKPTRVASPRC